MCFHLYTYSYVYIILQKGKHNDAHYTETVSIGLCRCRWETADISNRLVGEDSQTDYPWDKGECMSSA